MIDNQIDRVRKEIDDVQLYLITIERRACPKETLNLMQDVDKILLRVEAQMYKIDNLIMREPASTKQNNLAKMDQLRNDLHLIKSSYKTVQVRYENQCKKEKEREELLTKRFTTNSETRVNMGFDHELNMNDRVKSSGNMIDEMIAQGAHILTDLGKQKSNLLSIRKRFFFVAKSIGLSDTTIQFIDKRVREDKTIFIAGCICCTIFMVCFYYWWKGY